MNFMKPAALFVVLPAYNEAAALPSLLAALPAKLADILCEVIVVDDGSSDRTAQIAARYPVTLLAHERNRGLGAALLTGIRYAAGRGAPGDLLLTLDADDTHDPALFRQMLPKLSDADIVIASRYCPGGKQTGVGPVRALLSRAMSALLKLVFPVAGVTDYSSGFRAYRLAAIQKGLTVYGDRLIESAGFACMPELLVKLAKLGARAAEVPLCLHYELKKSASKFRPLALIKDYGRLFGLLRRALGRRQ